MRRLFPVLVILLLLPAFVGSCDNPKKGKNAAAKEKKEEPPKPTIGGKYETTLDVTKFIDTGNIPATVTGDVNAVLNFKPDSTLTINLSTRAEAAVKQIDNALVVPVDIDGEGSWSYNEKTKLLVINLNKTDIDVGELTLKDDVRFASVILRQFGGVREQIKSELRRTIFDKGEISVTAIADNSFEGKWRINGEDLALIFKKTE